jgi:hypothetical protein
MARFSMELPAWISVLYASEQTKSFEAVTRDVSADGAFIHTDQPLPVGTDIEMNLILPLDIPSNKGNIRSRIDVSGSVVRTESQGMAVCFDKKYQISPMT